MICFRAFMLYDFQRDQFYLTLRRNIELDCDWLKMKKEIQSQIKLQKVLDDKEFNFQSNMGEVRGRFDFITKRLLILITHNCVDGIYQVELLHQVYAHLIDNPNYTKMNAQELEIQEKFKIDKIMKLKEQQLIQTKALWQSKKQPVPKQNQLIQSAQKIITNTTLSSEENDNQSSQRKQIEEENTKAFRGFLMYDYNKQYFLMFVRKDFNNDKSWTLERTKIERILIERQKSPPQMFSIESEYGQYLFDYDADAKLYYILLSNKKTTESAQSELIQKIKGFVGLESNYYKQKKQDFEYQFLYAISDVIDAEERIYQSKYGKKSISLNVISQNKIESLNVLPENSSEEKKDELKFLKSRSS